MIWVLKSLWSLLHQEPLGEIGYIMGCRFRDCALSSTSSPRLTLAHYIQTCESIRDASLAFSYVLLNEFSSSSGEGGAPSFPLALWCLDCREPWAVNQKRSGVKSTAHSLITTSSSAGDEDVHAKSGSETWRRSLASSRAHRDDSGLYIFNIIHELYESRTMRLALIRGRVCGQIKYTQFYTFYPLDPFTGASTFLWTLLIQLKYFSFCWSPSSLSERRSFVISPV